MEIPDTLKWIGVMVAAGVITGITLNYVTGYLASQAQLAARAEIQKTLTLLLEQNVKASPSSSLPPAILPNNTYTM